MEIVSPSNSLIKHAASLKQKKYRQIHSQFLAEGLNLVCDIFLSNSALVESVFVTMQAFSLFSKDKAFLKANKNSIHIVSDLIIKKLSDTDTTQGIVAVVRINKQDLDCQINRWDKSKLNDQIVFLDKISDPGNLGTIIRTAVAANFSLVLSGCADPFSPKVVRSSMGSIIKADIKINDHSALSFLKQNGYVLIGADLNGQCLTGAKKHGKVCIVIGSEAKGISGEVQNLCDQKITIPMKNQVESLNAAVSAGIMMYHFAKF
ncbi:MAG: RNA methyltransferase [Firmicutes bacterium]|nr:RNA methyltransferase [Bacillota bacterium]